MKIFGISGPCKCLHIIPGHPLNAWKKLLKFTKIHQLMLIRSNLSAGLSIIFLLIQNWKILWTFPKSQLVPIVELVLKRIN